MSVGQLSNLITLVAKKLGDAGVRYRIMGRHGLFLRSRSVAPSQEIHIDVERFAGIRDLFKDYVFEEKTMKHVLFPGVIVEFHVPERWKDGESVVYSGAIVHVGTFAQMKEEAKFDRRLLDEILKVEA
jgi:hypothetical protein